MLDRSALLAPRADEVWKNDWLVKRFLEGVRGGIPYASDQIEVMQRLLAASGRPVDKFLDLGSGSGLLAIAIQHEMDHLDGRLFIDRLGSLKKDLAKKKLLRERKERETELPLARSPRASKKKGF